MSTTKRRKIVEKAVAEASNSDFDDEQDNYSVASGSEQSSESIEEDASADTEEEIAEAKKAKSKKTLKRKRRATDATHFGSTLQSLLSTDAPSALPLSLKPSLARKRNDEKLEAKGKKVK